MDEARFEIRHGTQDQEVFDEVVVANQYLLADAFPPDSLVIDIGANIGCFAAACLLRGADMVVCLEPSPDNFRQLTHNLDAWPGKAVGVMAGVWRSDIDEEVSFSPGGGTAAGCCFRSAISVSEFACQRVNTIGLDSLILQCTNNGERRIQLLKIDAEFSEYPILYSSTRLDLVDEIIGEAHEFTDSGSFDAKYYKHGTYKNTVTDICLFLQNNGFTVSVRPESFDNQTNTLFFATRPGVKK